jgi:hypothetical protein
VLAGEEDLRAPLRGEAAQGGGAARDREGRQPGVPAGIWAFGLMIYTVALKIAARVFAGRMRIEAAQG